jgi:hypothetical protein
LANEHVARYPDRPDLVPFKVTLQDLIARRDANRAAASMTSDAGNSLAQEANNDGQSDDDEEDEDEDEEDAADDAAATAVALTFMAAHLFEDTKEAERSQQK